MKNNFKKIIASMLVFTFIACSFYVSHANTQKHYLGSPVNTGKNNGYSGTNAIGEKDLHFGWELGRFYVSGHTRVMGDKDAPIFIKTLGDEVTLRFNLEQDIDNLNGDSSLTIAEHDNAFDAYFGIERTNFGRGALIIRHTDWQNSVNDIPPYFDYLSAVVVNADTEVMFLEEGDYEIALNYAVNETGLFGTGFFDTTNNYRIFFKLSVRNGESMIFPLEVDTGAELTNRAVTTSGFYLDLAMSRYLDIDIKREVMTHGADGLTEDTRFNRPARDGERYTEEGIYTITVSNRYTNQQTEKRIYVGSNNVLMAHVVTELPIDEINGLLALGAHIADDGTIIPASVDVEQTDDVAVVSLSDSIQTISENEDGGSHFIIIFISIIILLLIVGIVLFFVIHRKRNLSKACCDNCGDGNNIKQEGESG
jgi:hypothetical protein